MKDNYTYTNKEGIEMRRTFIEYQNEEVANSHYENVLKKVCGDDKCGLDGLVGWFDAPYMAKEGEC